MINRAVVIYHANCDDGFGAALAFWKYMAPSYSQVVYHPGVYGENPPYADSHTSVWILDFSYDPETMCILAGEAGNVHVLDHHVSAERKWKQYFIDDLTREQPANLHVDFDMSRSGSMMALDFFAGNDKYDKLFEFLEDRDLWRFENNHTQFFTYYLRSQPMDFETWDSIAEQLNDPTCYAQIVRVGSYLKGAFDKQCQEIVATNAREININGHTGLVCNCSGQFASDVGNLLAKASGTFGATYYANNKNEHVFSLRSVGEYDVSKIASYFGGGGHRNAAGFKLKDPAGQLSGVNLWNTGLATGTSEEIDNG